MHFLDDSLLPENQQKLVIQVAPYGPQWIPGDSNDIPVTMEEQIQKAVDCYNAGATVLHVHVREADGKGSKRLSMFNEMLDRLDIAFASQRAFMADVSHELRTPITVIRGHLETLGEDPNERREAVAIVEDELDQIGRAHV